MDFGRGHLALLAVILLGGGRACSETVGEYRLGNVDQDSLLEINASFLRRQAGGNIQLTCSGSTADLEWTYPGKKSNHSMHGSSSVSLSWVEAKSEWSSTLSVVNATHLDTGEYSCARGNRSAESLGTDAADRASERRPSVFVFVSDPSRLFQGLTRAKEPTVLVGVTGRRLLLPCGVTSPDVRVKLFRTVGTADRALLFNWTAEAADGGGGLVASAQSGLQYDPRRGFLVEISSLQAAGTYICQVEHSGSIPQEKRLHLRVLYGSQLAISQPWMSSPGGYAYAQGSTMSLHCTTNIFSGNPVTWTWMKNGITINNSTDRRVSIESASTRQQCTNQSSSSCASSGQGKLLNGSQPAYTEVASRLVIRGAVVSDSGEYQCSASTVGINRFVTEKVTVSS